MSHFFDTTSMSYDRFVLRPRSTRKAPRRINLSRKASSQPAVIGAPAPQDAPKLAFPHR